VFGLLGAAAVIMFRRGVNPLTTGVGTALVLNLFITFTIPGISIGGHIGGAIAGAAVGALIAAPRHRRQPEWVTYLAPIGVAVAAVVVSVLVTSP
jgi:membrane associated rhomboid family serine protease